jgi:hypothetical protein
LRNEAGNQQPTDEARALARKFIEEQKRILEEHGDGVVEEKYKHAVASVQEVFQTLAAKRRMKKKAATRSKR